MRVHWCSRSRPTATPSSPTPRGGQFLTLRIPSERTGSVARCYSLASSPFTDDLLKVTVKRTSTGYASNWLCDNVRTGDLIEVLPPAGGVFTPKDFDDDLLLFAGGSGITPVMSILKAALSEGSHEVVLFYANRDESSVIFAGELRELAAAYAGRLTVLHWLESVQGVPTVAQLAALSAKLDGHRVFTCGPALRTPGADRVRGNRPPPVQSSHRLPAGRPPRVAEQRPQIGAGLVSGVVESRPPFLYDAAAQPQ